MVTILVILESINLSDFVQYKHLHQC